MRISENRIGHSVSGKVYLAAPGAQLDQYKAKCREVYGNLKGVKFHDFPKGTRFGGSTSASYWVLDSLPVSGN